MDWQDFEIYKAKRDDADRERDSEILGLIEDIKIQKDFISTQKDFIAELKSEIRSMSDDLDWFNTR